VAAGFVTIGLLVLAVLFGWLIGWFAGDHTGQDWVYAFSGSFEAVGLLLVAAPEVMTALRRLGAWTAAQWRKFTPYLATVERFVRRLLRRPRHIVVNVGAASVVSSGGQVTTRVSPGEGKTLEEKIDYLLRRDEAMQARVDSVELRMSGLPSEWRTEIEEASETLHSEQMQALDELRERHLEQRWLGIVLLLIGVVLATVANLM
jgi:hypothetical protein